MQIKANTAYRHFCIYQNFCTFTRNQNPFAMIKNRLLLAYLLLFSFIVSSAQEFTPNYDESKIPPYTLPNPLVFEDGTPVSAIEQWDKRRIEILQLFEKEMYGVMPGWEGGVHAETIYLNDTAMAGQVTVKEIKLTLKYQRRELEMYLLLHIPNSRKNAPLFLGYNFYGNHTTTHDPKVHLTKSWVNNNIDFDITENKATDSTRGVRVNRWPYQEILARGYATGTIYYGDVDPDFDDDFKNGVHGLLNQPADSSSWASVAAWAWGLSRVLDYLETDDRIDPDRIAVLGHSRLGKAAVWAGATDERFAMVISNNSGCGGAAISRRQYGETVWRINNRFPHWFNPNFSKYNEKEHLLPFDQHQLLALIAPRPLYVASATEDQWADPKGEFLSAVEATKVYRFMGLTGLPVAEMPSPDSPVIHGTIGYHIRTGKHDITLYDWQQYMNFADRFWGTW